MARVPANGPEADSHDKQERPDKVRDGAEKRNEHPCEKIERAKRAMEPARQNRQKEAYDNSERGADQGHLKSLDHSRP